MGQLHPDDSEVSENRRDQETITAEALLRDIYQDRRTRYQEAIEDQLKTLSGPASLDELHVGRLKIPA